MFSTVFGQLHAQTMHFKLFGGPPDGKVDLFGDMVVESILAGTIKGAYQPLVTVLWLPIADSLIPLQ